MKNNTALTVIVTVFALGSVVALAQGGPPQGEKRKPPQAAWDACASKSVDDTCTVQHGDHTMNGTCRADREDTSKLVCAPSGPPPQGKQNR